MLVSEKAVRRLMKEEGVEVRCAKGKRGRSGCIGEITPAVDDLVKRRFKAESPNELWLTDITEFSAADGKPHLGPVIDRFDGKVVSRAVSDSPDDSLVERMVDEAIAALRDEGRRPIVRTDRGGRCRGGMRMEKLEGRRMRRSMSRKGNSGDNAACGGFFGRMKAEMRYGIRREAKAALKGAIEDYPVFYNEERIKASLGGLSVKEYRDKLEKMSGI